jgi:decaprenyl-phosphate phosphoribosyltransferase
MESKRSLPVAILVSMRPRQWVKNLLVFAVPLAANDLFHKDVLVDTIRAFIAFCLISSSVYVLNDILDVAADREHPKKRFRPIPAGDLPIPLAWGLAAFLVLAGLAVAATSGYPAFLITLCVYIVSSLSYTLGLKHEPVVELGLIALGFVLRAVAGGTATGIPISPWFLTVAAFGSLFMAAGKRYSELVSLGDGASMMRPALAKYSATYLRFVWTVAAAIMLTGYCLWAFQVAARTNGSVLASWSAVPFVLAVLCYALDIDRGDAGAPEDIAHADRTLQILALVWLVMFGLGAAGIGR